MLRSKAQSAFTPSVFRRFNSDEASQEKSSIESADGESSSVQGAIDSASESASTYASEAAEKVTDAAEYARDSVADAVGYQPREHRGGRQTYDSRGGNVNDRSFGGDHGGRGGNRGGYGGDRGGYGGDRGGYGGDRGGRTPQSFSRSNAPERILTPTSSIYVGNLLFDIADSDLQREFKQFGDIKSVTIATDARGLSKGYATAFLIYIFQFEKLCC